MMPTWMMRIQVWFEVQWELYGNRFVLWMFCHILSIAVGALPLWYFRDTLSRFTLILCIIALCGLTVPRVKKFMWRFGCKLRNDENTWIIPLWTAAWILCAYSTYYCTDSNTWSPSAMLALEIERIRNFIWYGRFETTLSLLIESGAIATSTVLQNCETLWSWTKYAFIGATIFMCWALSDDIGTIIQNIKTRLTERRTTEEILPQAAGAGAVAAPPAQPRALTRSDFYFWESIQYAITAIGDLLAHRVRRG